LTSDHLPKSSLFRPWEILHTPACKSNVTVAHQRTSQCDLRDPFELINSLQHEVNATIELDLPKNSQCDLRDPLELIRTLQCEVNATMELGQHKNSQCDQNCPLELIRTLQHDGNATIEVEQFAQHTDDMEVENGNAKIDIF